MKKILFFILFILTVNQGFAQKNIRTVYDTIRLATNSDKEIELYKLLYQNTKDSNSSSYSMVVTLITIMVAFLIFILGSQAFFNYRLNKRDLENLKSELQLKITTDIGTLQNNQQTLELALRKEINDKNDESKQSLNLIEKNISTRLNIMNSYVSKLAANDFALKGHTQAALINFVVRCEAELAAKLDLSLKISLVDLNEFLIPLTEINQYAYKNIPLLIQNVKKEFPTQFDDILNTIEEEFKKKTLENE